MDIIHDLVQSVVYPALAGILTTALGLVLLKIAEVAKRYASTLKHGQAVGVVFDEVAAVWSKKLAPSMRAKLADGKVTDAEWAEFKAEVVAEARAAALVRLKDLSGFAPSDIGKWVEVQLESALGELIGRVSNGEVSEETLANTPASEEESK